MTAHSDSSGPRRTVHTTFGSYRKNVGQTSGRSYSGLHRLHRVTEITVDEGSRCDFFYGLVPSVDRGYLFVVVGRFYFSVAVDAVLSLQRHLKSD